MGRTDGGTDITSRLLSSPNPVIRYKTRKLLLGEPAESAPMKALRREIASSRAACALLSPLNRDGTITTHPYKKWQGPHWTLYCLAQIEHPPGDPRLERLRDQVYDWLLEKKHLLPPRSLSIPGQEDRFRRCATQEGNAIWYSIVLGIDDERTRELARRLITWQWPDGGWNCDKRPEARTSSVIESLAPVRALHLAGRRHGDPRALECAEKAAEFFLTRRLFKRLRDGRTILPGYTKIMYPIQFYDVLFSLTVMADIGRIRDPRCADALELLASKELPGGGFPVEMRNAVTSRSVTTRGTYADWGPSGKGTMNEHVTADAMYVLKSARH